MELDHNQTSTGVFVDKILGMDTNELNSSVIYLDGNKDINFHNFSV